MDDITRISEMEDILNECKEALEGLHGALDRMEELQDDMGVLFSYYGSEVWFEDRELELPPDVKAGVLSEDLVYDAITDARDASFRMLEMATDILKNKIWVLTKKAMKIQYSGTIKMGPDLQNINKLRKETKAKKEKAIMDSDYLDQADENAVKQITTFLKSVYPNLNVEVEVRKWKK